ncbi:MAG: anti-anti-sigma factor [Acidimicrobiales bacterium]|nr:anti-anti-sigma factor [Acidimicrobiales bacterium]
MGPSDQLQVVQARTGDQVTLAIRGELDLLTAPLLATAVEEVIASDCSKVVLDCAQLTYLDSTGIAVLIRAWDGMKGRATMPVVVTNITDEVRRVLDVCGIISLVTE